MKVKAAVLSLAIIPVFIFIVGKAFLGPAYLMTDGCPCGTEREYIAYPVTYTVSYYGIQPRKWPLYQSLIEPRKKQLKLRMAIKKQGRLNHKHQYWDATWLKEYQ